ncbi:helix-turn-helix domain-containing protein [Scleromatobacter humisilvae]|uniref:Response regulator n=1 Tax=Scleromatobacter humisilvae TaxID=2897159 RepID=A0A9X2C002_9BURK|nr:helix-turn-helix domain-containing protein [Scleromatobacter humisilvae]MCK9686867.1 response regulator [Scleromatobacter humisilvae]
MDDIAQTRPPAEAEASTEPAISLGVRRFLVAHGVKEHNHASEIARIINVDRSQSYRRLKGDVSWSHTDLRAVAHHFGAPDDHLLPRDDLARYAHAAGEAVPAVIRVAHLPPTGLLVPGAELAPGDSSDLVAIRNGSSWEVHVTGDEPFGAKRHAIEALTIRSHPHLRVAVLEDDTRAAEALVEAFRPLGIVATPYADAASLEDAIAQRRFDAYVLDWLLTDGTAVGIVEEIRRHNAHIPILVVTGALMANSAMEQSLLELSAQWNFSTLDKPVRPMNLANALKQMVSASRA